METKKNWFTYLSLIIFEIFLGYALFSGMVSIGNAKTYQYLWYGGILAAFGAVWILLHVISSFMAHFKVSRLFSYGKLHSIMIESVLVIAVLIAAAAARIWVIRNIVITPSSDYQTYYTVAQMLTKGTLFKDGVGLCAYISEFPHVIGYPFVLSLLFRIVGPSVTAGLYLNLTAGLISIVLAYRIARLLCGRIGGFVALIVVAFWPSQILYSNLLASESIFTCMMLFSIWIAVHLFLYPKKTGKISLCIFMMITTGVTMALASAVRPMSEILLVAIILCLIPCVTRFGELKHKIGAFRRAVCQGWFQALVVLISYFLCAQIVSACIVGTIGLKLPSGTVSYGYNLLVGVNIKDRGAWNEQDAKLLSDTYSQTNSAQAAHKVALDLALKRISDDPVGVANLMMEKYTFLWSNDDYAFSWNTLFLSQQNHLTAARKDLINKVTQWNDYYYMLCLFLAAAAGFALWRRKYASPVQMMILFFIGTAVVHMILECQNRYHYNILPIFAICAAIGVSEIYHSHSKQTQPDASNENYTTEELVAAAQAPELPSGKPKQFDMLQAIQNGHVTVTATEAYQKASEEARPEENKKPSGLHN